MENKKIDQLIKELLDKMDYEFRNEGTVEFTISGYSPEFLKELGKRIYQELRRRALSSTVGISDHEILVELHESTLMRSTREYSGAVTERIRLLDKIKTENKKLFKSTVVLQTVISLLLLVTLLTLIL